MLRATKMNSCCVCHHGRRSTQHSAAVPAGSRNVLIAKAIESVVVEERKRKDEIVGEVVLGGSTTARSAARMWATSQPTSL